MNNYESNVRKRGRTLLIVEGNHEKNQLFGLIFKCFPEINIDMNDVWIYGTNIYLLYEDISKEYGKDWIDDELDIDLPFIISKKQHREPFYYKDDFINIILVFDYERHDGHFSIKKIIYHNIYKANRILNPNQELEQEQYKQIFEKLDLNKILDIQNSVSSDTENGFIWVLSTCVFFVAEYNFDLIL